MEPTEPVVKLEQAARGLLLLEEADWGATARVALVFGIGAEAWVVVATML